VTEPASYALPDAELVTLFQREVRAFVFDGHRPAAATPPVLVLLGGQPGAGKSMALARIAQRNPDQDLVPLTSDVLRQFHPAYRHLLATDPLAMPNATQPAVAAWVRMSIDTALKRRYSPLLEGVFRDPVVVVGTARRFAESGYRTEVVAMAVRAERSRLDILSRFLAPGGGPARWTPPTAHDHSYRQLPETLAAAETSSDVHRITVTTRQGTPVFANQRDAVGLWEVPAGAAAALQAERARPFDPAGARSWIDGYRQVVAVLTGSGGLGGRGRPVLEQLVGDADRVAAMAWPDPRDGRRMEHAARQRLYRELMGVEPPWRDQHRQRDEPGRELEF